MFGFVGLFPKGLILNLSWSANFRSGQGEKSRRQTLIFFRRLRCLHNFSTPPSPIMSVVGMYC